MSLNRFREWLSNTARWLVHADNWIIRVIYGTIGLLLASAFQEYAEKRLNVGSLPQYLMVFFVLVSVLFITRYLKRMEDARKSDRTFIENQFTEFQKIENKFDNFLGQVNLTLSENLQLTRQELSQAFLQSFRCTFMQNQDERLKTIVEYVNKAEANIYILSELSTQDEINKPAHNEYLDALNNKIAKKTKDKFKIYRIVVPPDNGYQGSEDWLKAATKDTSYEEHFRLLQNFRETSLLKYPNGPKGVSILLIDNQFLFLQFKKNYHLKSLNGLLSGGFLFDDFSKSLTMKFQQCFEDMIVYAEPIDFS